MDLTREFLEKVEEMVQPQTLTEGIRTFVDKPMHMLVDEIAADTPLRTNSLSSVADYIKSNADFDALASDGRKIIHVEDEKNGVALHRDEQLQKAECSFVGVCLGIVLPVRPVAVLGKFHHQRAGQLCDR